MLHNTRLPLAVPAAVCFAIVVSSAAAWAQTTTRLQDEVAKALARERDFRTIKVAVEEGRVVLRGDVPTLWVKTQAIARALKVEGVKEVASELTIAKGENDKALVESVARVIRGYEHYTMWDYLSGSVRNGVVTLRGKVTPFPDKSKDLAERISKVRGVQDLQNELVVLPPSRSDEDLRYRLAQRIFSQQSFQQFASAVDPPFHIIVENGIITLVGYVQTQAEYIELAQIVGHTEGILRIDNQLQTLTPRR
jgi:osmotically-inducible protein OsmY